MCYRGVTSFASQQGSARQSTWHRLGSFVGVERFQDERRLRLSPSSLAGSRTAPNSAWAVPPRRCVADDRVAATRATEPSVTSSVSTTTVLEDETHKAESSGALALSAGAYVLPHPDKVDKGGEDWYFIAKNRRAVGVADGVGGWSEVGVDAGAYARQLMGNAADASEDGSSTQELEGASDPQFSAQDVLENAYQLTTARGSATACIAVINGNSLDVSNLGDSGLLVLRGGAVVFHTPQQQHGFNFPYQIGSADSMSDSPSSAQRFTVELQAGDLLVLGTDGLWDNCFDEEVASVLKYCVDRSMDVAKMAQVLAHYARHRASDSKFASPFAYAAFQAGYAYMGGKMDDITVVVCLAQATGSA